MLLSPFWLYDTFGEYSPLVSRFSIALVSSVLLGMTVCGPVQTLTGAAGTLGTLFYAYRTWLVSLDYRAFQDALRERAESRLELFISARPEPLPLVENFEEARTAK